MTDRNDRNFRIWIFVIIVAIIFLMIQALASVAHAAKAVCTPVETLLDQIAKDKFVKLWSGNDKNGYITAIFQASDKSWLAVVFMPDMSQACIVDHCVKSSLESTST